VCGTTRLRRREGAVKWQSPISPQMFLQTGLGRASTRQLGQPPVGGDWVLPRYSRCPHRPTLISQNYSEQFRKFKCTAHKKFREWVVCHTLFECVGNATRGLFCRRNFYKCSPGHVRKTLALLFSFLNALHCLPRTVGVPLESALNLVSRMGPGGARATHFYVLGVMITCSMRYDRANGSTVHRGTYHILQSTRWTKTKTIRTNGTTRNEMLTTAPQLKMANRNLQVTLASAGPVRAH